METETERPPSKEVSRGPCPSESCSSSDGCVLFDDGHSYCFVCSTYFHAEGREETRMDFQPENKNVVSFNNNPGPGNYGFLSEIRDRKITKETCRHYGVKVVQDSSGNIVKHIYPYYDQTGSLVANKIRVVQDKQFLSEPAGSLTRAVLFGQNLFGNQSGKYITICEGEIDALSVSQMTGNRWPVVSIKDGAAAAVRNCKASYDFLNRFENIIISFDNDEPGKKASRQVADLFEPNKCKIVHLDLKDANEYLKEGRQEDYIRRWWSAKLYTPAGIINLADYGDSLYEETQQRTCPYPFEGLNEKLYGIRTGELVTLTAGTGTGKSSVMRELMHHILNSTSDNIGIISLEENVRNTIFHLMSVEASARLYIKEVRESFGKDDLVKWQNKTVGTGRFFAFDHFGSVNTEEILARVRYMVKALDCKWIFIDHLSILVSGLEGVDERRNIDILMTKLRSLVEESKCALILVSHLRRTTSDSGHEEGREVSLSHLRGSQSIAQLSDAVIAMERDQQADDPVVANTTTIRVLKNRYTGETGVACYLLFNKETGRLKEVEGIGDTQEDDDGRFKDLSI